MCNKPAMHRVVNGWEPDYDTDCIEDPKDILNYCKKVRFLLFVRFSKTQLQDISKLLLVYCFKD